ncbi:MAG: FecR domain-containing protein [Myxococcota bacterium]
MNAHRPLSEWVKPVEPARAELQLEWHDVRRRVKRRRQLRVAVPAVAALLLAGVVGALALRPPRLEEGQRLDALVAQTVRLDDGSRLQLAQGSTTRVETVTEADVVVLLEQGRVTFDVSKRPTRRFVVKANEVEVRVVGTKFTVERLDDARVAVDVHEGIVEVREHGAVHRLVRGRSWATHAPSAELPVRGETPSAEPPPAVEQPELVEPTPPSAEEPTATRPPKRTHVERPARPSGGGGAGMATEAPTKTSEPLVTAEPKPEPTPAPSAPPEPTAADAFAAAMRARGAGHVKEAIVGFQQVCERYPSSAYAPMSAFEWGRLALDAQDDPRQAARAFERTLELATSSSLIEDALARLTEAYARYDVGSCRRVQAEYLRRFPGGPHVRGVTKACP